MDSMQLNYIILLVFNKKIRGKGIFEMTREYIKVCSCTKWELIKKVIYRQEGSTKKIAKGLGVKYEAAKLIIRQHKKGHNIDNETCILH